MNPEDSEKDTHEASGPSGPGLSFRRELADISDMDKIHVGYQGFVGDDLKLQVTVWTQDPAKSRETIAGYLREKHKTDDVRVEVMTARGARVLSENADDMFRRRN